LEVGLSLKGVLRDYLPRQAKGKTTLTLPDGVTVDDLIQQMEITQTVLVVVNGNHVETDCALQNGDDVQLLPMVRGGGCHPS
jgi:sulfur carrier protein ThiS